MPQSIRNTTGMNALTNEQAEFYQRTMLTRLQDEIVFSKYAKKPGSIAKRSGDVTSWRRLEMPTISTTATAITEGVTPAELDQTVNKVSAQVKQYGAWTKVTDLLDMVGLDPLITEISQMFGDHGAIVTDYIVRDVLNGGTQAQFAGNKASRATVTATDKLTATEILKARTTLKKQNVKMFTMPNGKKGYLAFINPDAVAQLLVLPEFEKMNMYTTSDGMKEGIIGQLYGVYFVEANHQSTFAGAGAAGANITVATIVGDEAYGITDVAGSSKPSIIVKNANGDSSDTSNPLNLWSTIAWKNLFAAVRLNEKAILRLEFAY